MNMESLINLQHVLAALHCASCEKTRFYLQGVCVEIRERESFAVATDGCVLFASHFALEPDAPVNTLLGSFILHKDSLKAMKLRRTSSYVSTMTQLDTATVRIICNDQDLYAKLIDGVFLDWRRIVPNDVSLGEAAKNINCIEYNTHTHTSWTPFGKWRRRWACAANLAVATHSALRAAAMGRPPCDSATMTCWA